VADSAQRDLLTLDRLTLDLCDHQARLLDKAEALYEPKDRIIRLPEVMHRCGISKRTIGRLERAGRFPHRQKIGARAVGWTESQVAAWIVNPAAWSIAYQPVGPKVGG